MKKHLLLFTTCLTILLMSTKTEAAGNLQITYNITFPEAQAHYMDVEMNIGGISQPFIDLKMPVWTPGSYLVREYAKSVEQLTAEHNGKALSAKKTNKNTWHVLLQGANTVKVKYRLYCFEVSVRNNFVTSAEAFIVGASTFLYPAGMISNPSTIHITPYKGWDKVSTSLDMVGTDAFTVHAPNYDILYDSPIEVGNQDVFGFDAAGVKYEVAMCMGGNYDKERVKKDLKKIVEKETEIFGENPNKRYVFIIHNYSKAGGGLEHLSSTVLGVIRDSYGTEAGYQRFLALVAHEHFHLWNVKRLRPIALGPFDYDTENYTTDLWIAEGFTNYFDNLVVHRLGLYTTENYYTALAGDINLIENTPGNKVQPMAEASYDAWIKYYRPTENAVNMTVSYYSKGTVAAMMLDLEIIQNSKGKYCMDDVMKYMYTEYYKTKRRGYTDDEFKQGLEKFAGKNLDDFYKKYIYGVADVAYNHYLGYAGLELVDDLAKSNEPSLGITMVKEHPTFIATVLRGGTGWVDGLNVNDEITSIDGKPFTDMATALAGKKVGDKLVVNVGRDGLLYSIPVTLQKNNTVKYRITSVANPTAQQMMVREKWLKH
jgi:predicted metalloprotease with PDZ domain